MIKILDLREKRAKAWETTKAFLETKEQNGKLSAEDTATYEKMETDVAEMGKQIDRLEKQALVDAELNKATTEPITNQPNQNGEAKKGRASDNYKEAFWKAMRTKGTMLRPEIQDALTEGTDSEGGYLVPDEYEKTLIQALEEENIFRSLAHVINTNSGDRKIPIVATKGTANWIDEGDNYPQSDDSFSQISISAYKLATMMKVSEELLNDSVFDLASYIATEFSRRVGNAEEDAFLNGNGTGRPTGILAATGGAQIGKTAASSTAVTLDEILDLHYSLKSPYRNKAVFILNDSTIKAIRKLKDANGQYLWQPSVQNGQPDRLLNKSLYTSSYMPEIEGGKKAIAFGDFSYYWIADRQTRRFKQLNELYAETGQVGFQGVERVDGKLVLPEAIKVLQMKAGA